MKKTLVCWGILVGFSGCESEGDRAIMTQRLTADQEQGPPHLPVDRTEQLEVREKPSKIESRKIQFRKATEDEVEELNATYRTKGSRDRLLAEIEAADGTNPKSRQMLVARYRAATSVNLKGDNAATAAADLQTVLSKIESRKARK